MCYNKNMEQNQFEIEFTLEAKNELAAFDSQNQKRILLTLRNFEAFGRKAVNSRPLDNKGLFELKCGKTRAYFMYFGVKIVIIGPITLKKTGKAPERYKNEAHNRIASYIKERDKK